MLCWMDAEPLSHNRKYLIKHTTRVTKVAITAIAYRLDIGTLQAGSDDAAQRGLAMNDIGRVRIRTRDALLVDAYECNRATGAFIMIDEVTNHTVAAGMIVADPETTGKSDA